MTGAVLAPFAGSSTEPEDVCAAIRWIAPHVHPDAGDALMLEALSLAELLPADVEALWLWWLACTRPDLVSPASYEECEALPADVRAVLGWVVKRGPQGVDTYAAAQHAAQPYLRAVRELERAAREYPVLNEVLAAVKAGVKDPNLVMAQLSGGWSSSALRDGRKSVVTAAFVTRDRATQAGVPADLPALRMPRFSSISEPYRSLALDALAGLPGGTGIALSDIQPQTMPLPEAMHPGRRAWLVQQLRRRGLPAVEVPLDESFWLAAIPLAAEEWVQELDGGGPGRTVVQALNRLLSGAADATRTTMALADCAGYWSEGQRHQAADAAVTTCLAHGRTAGAADLIEELAADYPELVQHHLDAALQDLSAPEVTLLAFNQRLRASVRELAQHQEQFA